MLLSVFFSSTGCYFNNSVVFAAGVATSHPPMWAISSPRG